jgi:hypothetical protein
MEDNHESPPPVQQEPSELPSYYQAPPQPIRSATRNWIPTENPSALLAYYFAIFGLVPGFCLVLGPAAMILGIVGLNRIKANPGLPGRAHAWIGVIVGGITTLICIAIICIAIYGGLQSRS